MIYWPAMSRDFPDWIDVDRAAHARRQFAGRARLEWLQRALDQLELPASEDEIEFEIRAFVDDQAQPRLSVAIHGRVPMRCQRTLKRYWQPVDSRSEVAVVASESELARLPDALEPKLVPNGRVRLMELVEDELLLALPLVPRDPSSQPVERTVGNWIDSSSKADSNRQSPFAALEALKHEKSKGGKH